MTSVFLRNKSTINNCNILAR